MPVPSPHLLLFGKEIKRESKRQKEKRVVSLCDPLKKAIVDRKIIFIAKFGSCAIIG